MLVGKWPQLCRDGVIIAVRWANSFIAILSYRNRQRFSNYTQNREMKIHVSDRKLTVPYLKILRVGREIIAVGRA